MMVLDDETTKWLLNMCPVITCGQAEVGPEPEYRESTPEGFCVFVSDPESKFQVKPDPASLLISGVAGVCVVISEVKTLVNDG